MTKLAWFAHSSFFLFTALSYSQQWDCQITAKDSVKWSGKQLPAGMLENRGGAYALLVGLDHYNSADLYFKDLRAPVKEITALSEMLQSNHYVVKTLINENATAAALNRWLTCFSKKALPSDRVLFYFSGHGGNLLALQRMMDDTTKDKHWERIVRARKNAARKADTTGTDELVLVLHQPEPSALSEFVFVNDLVQIISPSDAHQQIIWIDACYSGNANKIFALPLSSYSYRIVNEGFFALTGLKARTYDGLYGKYMLLGVCGLADRKDFGNEDGLVSLSEITGYIDHHVREEVVETSGISFRSRYIFVGSGSVYLTRTQER